jgi:hypothetical protein
MMIFILFFIFLNLYSIKSIQKLKNNHNEKINIIFIHGSYGITITNLAKLMYYYIFNKKKFNIFSHQLKQERLNCEISKHKAICSNMYGLVNITPISIAKKVYQTLFINIKNEFDKIYNNKNITYYTFNWSGILLNHERNVASKKLYREIKKISNSNPNSKTILIAFSHGGNVALGINKYHKKDTQKKKPIIDLLILLATPINKKSNSYASNKLLFSRIINFFSPYDFYQIADFTFNFPFAHRTLHKNNRISNITVTYIKKYIKKRTQFSPTHKAFGGLIEHNNYPSFLSFLPKILSNIIPKKNNNYKIKIILNKNY